MRCDSSNTPSRWAKDVARRRAALLAVVSGAGSGCMLNCIREEYVWGPSAADDDDRMCFSNDPPPYVCRDVAHLAVLRATVGIGVDMGDGGRLTRRTVRVQGAGRDRAKA